MKRSRRTLDTSEKVVSYKQIVKQHAEQNPVDSHFKSALLIVLGFVVLLAALIYALPAFHIKTVDVEGAIRLDEEAIIQDSGLVKGEHLLKDMGGSLSAWLGLRFSEAERLIMQSSPYVKSVRVRTKLPSGIQIDIEERVPSSYIILEDGAYLLMDTDAYVLEIREGVAPSGIPLMHGIVIDAATLGEQIVTPSIETIDAALTLLDAIIRSDRAANDSFSLLASISELRVPSADSLYLKVNLLESDIPIHAKLGDRLTYDDALNWLRYTIRTQKLDDLGSGVLDLSGSEYIFIRDVEEAR